MDGIIVEWMEAMIIIIPWMESLRESIRNQISLDMHDDFKFIYFLLSLTRVSISYQMHHVYSKSLNSSSDVSQINRHASYFIELQIYVVAKKQPLHTWKKDLMPKSYKDEQEAFVSNLPGTNVFDLVISFLHIPMLTLLAKVVLLSLRKRKYEEQSNKLTLLLEEYFVFVLPVLLCYTVGANYNHITLLMAIVLTILLFFWHRTQTYLSSTSQPDNTPKSIFQDTNYVTLFKGNLIHDFS